MSKRDRQDNRQPPDEAAEGGSARYGKPSGARGSGHQESKKPETKEERGFVPRQGGDQSDHGQSSGEPRRR